MIGWHSTPSYPRLLERAPAKDQEVLVPELLLAYAQDKVPTAAMDTILTRAEQMQLGAEPGRAAAIELTRALADHATDSRSTSARRTAVPPEV